jgi:hypothetical protein
MILQVDDNNEKMVFLIKELNQKGTAHIVTYLANLDEALPLIFKKNGFLTTKDLDRLNSSNSTIQGSHIISKEKYKMRNIFFHKDLGLFIEIKGESMAANKKVQVTYLSFLPRTSLLMGKDSN